jgi:hypothetical protein
MPLIESTGGIVKMVNLSENEKHQILEQRKTIQQITSHELKVVEKILVVDGSKIITEQEDYRCSLIESTQTYSSLLFPYFDDTIQNYYSEHIVYLEGWTSEILEKIKDKHFKEVYENAPDTSKDGNSKIDKLLAIQCREAKRFFKELNLFIQRNNLLSDSLVEVKKHE